MTYEVYHYDPKLDGNTVTVARCEEVAMAHIIASLLTHYTTPKRPFYVYNNPSKPDAVKSLDSQP